MTVLSDTGPLSFFKALQGAFSETVETSGKPHLADGLALQAFDSFEGNIALQSEGLPPIACFKGCSPCCMLRITATAPEIFLIAHFLRGTAEAYARGGIDLFARLIEADKNTRGLCAEGRMQGKHYCAFTVDDVCAFYKVRPLSCRGHTSYDRQACADAMSGKHTEVPVSQPHAVLRAIVQNALQSALRQAGLAWGCYELNHALQIALADTGCYGRWLAGEDVFAPALADDVNLAEMAKIFDAIDASAP
jgi:hypothetical protein